MGREWTWNCVQDLTGQNGEAATACSVWVREPSEANCVRALSIGLNGDRACPGTWLALAAGWSSGLMTVDEHSVPVLSGQCQRACWIAVKMACATLRTRERSNRAKPWQIAGGGFASGDALHLR